MYDALIQRFITLAELSTPSKQEKPVAEYIMQFCQDIGFAMHTDEAHKATGGNCGNIIAVHRVPQASKRIVFAAHMDTVIPCANVKAIVEDGIIHSDGTTILGADDKAGIAVMLEMMLACKDSVGGPEIVFVFTISEEIGLLGARHLDLSPYMPIDCAYILDSSGAVGDIVYAAPYMAKGELTVIGKEAHAGICPEAGISALCVAAEAISAMPHGRIDVETTANIGNIEGGLATNIVMSKVVMQMEARSMQEQKLVEVMRQVDAALQNACVKHGASYTNTFAITTPGFCIDTKSIPASIASTAAQAVGLRGAFRTSGGGSDANIFNQHGIASLNLAMGMQDVHTVHESISIQDLHKGKEWMHAIIAQF